MNDHSKQFNNRICRFLPHWVDMNEKILADVGNVYVAVMIDFGGGGRGPSKMAKTRPEIQHAYRKIKTAKGG